MRRCKPALTKDKCYWNQFRLSEINIFIYRSTDRMSDIRRLFLAAVTLFMFFCCLFMEIGIALAESLLLHRHPGGATTPCLLDLPTGFCLRFPAVSASALFIYSIKKISSELLSGYVLLSFYEFSEDVVPPLFTFTLSHNISTHCHNHNGTNNSHFGFLRNRSSTTVLSTPLSAVIP